jgi:hypothetical protein
MDDPYLAWVRSQYGYKPVQQGDPNWGWAAGLPAPPAGNVSTPGQGLIGGSLGMGGPLPMAPDVPAHQPGFALSQQNLQSQLAQQLYDARQTRAQDVTTHQRNVGAINSNMGERGVFFSGFRNQAQGRESHDFATQLAQIAHNVQQQRQANALQLAQLYLGDIAWRNQAVQQMQQAYSGLLPKDQFGVPTDVPQQQFKAPQGRRYQ